MSEWFEMSSEYSEVQKANQAVKIYSLNWNIHQKTSSLRHPTLRLHVNLSSGPHWLISIFPQSLLSCTHRSRDTYSSLIIYPRCTDLKREDVVKPIMKRRILESTCRLVWVTWSNEDMKSNSLRLRFLNTALHINPLLCHKTQRSIVHTSC